MMIRRSMIGMCVLALAGAAAFGARGQAPQPPSASQRIPQFENEHVRVWKSIIRPNQPLSMHRHERPRALIALVGGTMKIVQQSGESQTVTWETGKAYWLAADAPGTLHADVNDSDKPIEVMVVELQK